MKAIIALAFLILSSFNKVSTINAQQTYLEHATIIDVINNNILEDQVLEISSEGLITNISKWQSNEKDNKNKYIDLSGKYILPGLIDGHIHLFRPQNREEILEALLNSGITSVRDMGGDARVYQKIKRSLDNQEIEGPDLYYSANIFGPTFLRDPRTKFAARGYEAGQAPWMRVIHDASNLEEIVVQAKKEGVTGLKVYSNVSPELLTKLCGVAKSHGLQIWSHASIFPSKPSDAAKAGVAALSHAIGMIFENHPDIPDSYLDAIQKQVVLQDFENTDEKSQVFLDLYESMRESGTIFEPTLSAWAIRAPSGNNSPGEAQKGSPTVHLSKVARQLDIKSMVDWSKRITKAAFENGVLIAAGTDFSKEIKWIQNEMKLLKSCGLSNIEVIKSATINNAKVIGIEKETGSIEIGKRADLLILNANPLEDIDHIEDVFWVFKNGRHINNK